MRCSGEARLEAGGWRLEGRLLGFLAVSVISANASVRPGLVEGERSSAPVESVIPAKASVRPGLVEGERSSAPVESVIPAKAGIQEPRLEPTDWTPAFAGVTEREQPSHFSRLHQERGRPFLHFLACLLLFLLLTSPAHAQRRFSQAVERGPTVLLQISGDLSRGGLLHAATWAVPVPAGIAVRRIWQDPSSAVLLPNGQRLVAGGLPIRLEMAVPGAWGRLPAQLAFSQNRRQERGLGLIGLDTLTAMKRYDFQRQGTGRPRR